MSVRFSMRWPTLLVLNLGGTPMMKRTILGLLAFCMVGVVHASKNAKNNPQPLTESEKDQVEESISKLRNSGWPNGGKYADCLDKLLRDGYIKSMNDGGAEAETA